MTITIHMANDFSKFPSGRFETDGPHSAQKFRDELLYPAIQKGKVEVVLDGALTLGASERESESGASEWGAQTCPIKAQSAVVAVLRRAFATPMGRVFAPQAGASDLLSRSHSWTRPLPAW